MYEKVINISHIFSVKSLANEYKNIAVLISYCSILANGGEYEGNRILEKETVERMMHPATDETCSVTELPMQFSHGMQIFTNPNVSSCY